MLRKIARYLHVDYHKFLHFSSHGAHAAYFGLLFIEGHSMYASVGGLLFCFAVLDIFTHID